MLAISGAFALPSAMEKRSCSYVYQPQLWDISQHLPDASNGPLTTPFYVFNDIGKKDLVVSFRNVPSNAYGCQLEYDYHPNSPLIDQQVGDPTVINVYRVSDGGNFPYPITWSNTETRTGSLIGTWHFPSGSDVNTPVVRVIANFACSPIETFRFTVADPNARGGVSDPEDLTSGLRISYNC